MLSSPKVNAIYRYPVKGLSPEPLGHTPLTPTETVPGDRLYAIENGPSGFDPQGPRHQPKTRYLMLMRNERLATLRTRFDHATHTLSVDSDGRTAARGDLRTPEGRQGIESFFARKVVSIINLASVAALETALGVPVHPLRFRGNVYVESWPAWHEFDLLGKEI